MCAWQENAGLPSSTALAMTAAVRFIVCLAATSILFGAMVESVPRPCSADERSESSANDDAASSLPRVDGLELVDIEGRRHAPRELRRRKAVAVIVLGTECPVSNYYTSTYQSLFDEFEPRGVAFFGIHCDRTVSREKARAHAKEYGLTFPLVLDHEQRVARMLGVDTVPTAVILSSDGQVLYRGRIDDRFALGGRRRDEPQTREAYEALTAAVEGRVPKVRQTEPFGCPLPQ